MVKQTHTLIARIFEILPDVKEIIRGAFKIEDGMINSWARPKPSDINPNANGKGNPLDRTEKLIKIVHVYDPAEARILAEHFPAYCDELDRRAGLTEALENQNPCLAVFRVVESHAKLIKVSIGGCADLENMSELLTKTQQLKTAVNQLEGCIKGFLKESSPPET